MRVAVGRVVGLALSVAAFLEDLQGDNAFLELCNTNTSKKVNLFDVLPDL